MDFIVELLIQFIVQVLFEILAESVLKVLFRGGSRVAASRNGRWVVGTLLGCAVGFAWGTHLREMVHWPRLLWVSLALGAASVVLALGRVKEDDQQPPSSSGLSGVLGELFTPPWRWTKDRLTAFALINLGIAAGIAGAVAPTRLL